MVNITFIANLLIWIFYLLSNQSQIKLYDLISLLDQDEDGKLNNNFPTQ